MVERSLPQHLTSVDVHQGGEELAFFRSPSEDRSQYNGDVLKQSYTHSAKSFDAAPLMKRDPFTGCRFLLSRCDYACTGRKKKGRRGRTVKDERNLDEGRHQRFVQMNNASRLRSPSKDAARRPHRGDTRTRLQPRGATDTTPHHPESTTDSTMDAITTQARTRWKRFRPKTVAAQKAM
ncbi:hypothetical protein Aduo_016380 [Ancylostoma duodenale]